MVSRDAMPFDLEWLEDQAMSARKTCLNEIRFATRDRTLGLWMAVVLMLSTLSVGSGLVEVRHQLKTIENLLGADQQDRVAESSKLNDWGSAAYYSFHLTYAPPSEFAYAAIGQRDTQPWKHRIRMLALEGQIYEQDVINPSVALIGRFDFSFLASFVLPLVLIILLYDLKASERTAGRYNLLESMANRAESLWRLRAVIRVSAISVCLITPMILAGWFARTGFSTLLLASCAVLLYAAFWGVVCYGFSAWRKSGSVILISLIGCWVLTAVVIPAATRLLVDRLIPVPSGAEILMSQREAVNDAWDLPKDVTMDAFFKRHPQWSNYQPVQSSFEWQWYYAFQQVGDQKTEQLTNAYRNGRLQRDYTASWISLLAPPSLLERTLQSLAKTDLSAHLAYEKEVRSFHRALREFYYPKFFLNEAFDKAALANRPEFVAGK
ncbi:MAG TPA: DUF3526 domain-containing protein [Marinagarivorans sp.]